MFGWHKKNAWATSLEAQTAARREWLNERDSHCDMCADKDDIKPIRPVHRCPMHMNCMAGMVGDPLFGFDFERYKDAPQNAGQKEGCGDTSNRL
jgi:hypothetical protein